MRLFTATAVKKLILISGILFLIASILPYFLTGDAVQYPLPEKPFPESSYFNGEGAVVHYRLWEPSAPGRSGNILLIHGLGGSTFSWRHNIKPLTDAGYRVVAADLPLFGYSDRSQGLDHSHDTRSKLLWQLLDSTDVRGSSQEDMRGSSQEKWTIVGHSIGAGAAVSMAVQNPSRVSSLVFVDGALYSSRLTVMKYIMKYPPARKWTEYILKEALITRGRVEGILTSAYGCKPLPDDVDGYLQPLLLEGTEKGFPSLVKSSPMVPLKALKNHSIKMMAIWGDKDKWVEMDKGISLSKEFPSLQLKIIEGAGHCPMETHSEQFNSILLQFLRAD